MKRYDNAVASNTLRLKIKKFQFIFKILLLIDCFKTTTNREERRMYFLMAAKIISEAFVFVFFGYGLIFTFSRFHSIQTFVHCLVCALYAISNFNAALWLHVNFKYVNKLTSINLRLFEGTYLFQDPLAIFLFFKQRLSKRHSTEYR